MTDQQIGFKFGANTGGLDAGAQEVKGQLNGIRSVVGELGAAFANLGTQAHASMGKASEGVGEFHLRVKGALGPLREFSEATSKIGELVIAAFAVEKLTEFAKGIAEVAEKTRNTALTFGETTADVQRFRGEMIALGVSPDAAQAAFGRLDRALTTARQGNKTTGAAFKELGINVREPMTNVEAFNKTIEGLQRVQDIPTRVGLSFQLLGRNIEGIGPLLGMTEEQFKEAAKAVDDYGVVSDDAESKGLALAEAFNANKLATTGLTNTITSAFAPALTAIIGGINDLIRGFTESYNKGGLVRFALDIIGDGLKLVATGFVAMTTVAKITFDVLDFGIQFLADLCDMLIAVIKSLIPPVASLGPAWTAVSKVITEAISAVIGWVKRMGDAVWDFLGSLPVAGAGFRKMRADASAAFDRIGKDAASAKKSIEDMWSGKGAPLPKAHPAGGDLPDAKGAKTPKESNIDKLKEELDKLENAHNDTIQDMTAVELAFWKDVAAGPKMATLNEKEQATVRMSILRLEHQEAMKQIGQSIADRKDATTEAIADVQDEASRRHAAIAQEIKDVEDAEKRREISHAQSHARVVALIEDERKASIDAANSVFSIRKSTDDAIMLLAERGTSEYESAQRDETEAKKQRDRAIVASDNAANAALSANTRRTTDEYKREWDAAINPIVHSFTSGVVEMMTGAKSFGQFMKGLGLSILNDWVSRVVDPMIEKWLWGEATKTAATTAGATTRAAAENTGFFGSVIRLIAKALGLHVAGEAGKTGATVAGAAARTTAEATSSIATAAAAKAAAALQIPTLVGLAGAGGVASMAAAPFPIDLGAPAFGAAMASAAAGFGAVASAAGGFDIPRNTNPLVQAHAKEMILPAHLSDGIRGMIENGTVAGGGGGGSGLIGKVIGALSGAGQGDKTEINLHHSPNIQSKEPDLMRLVDKQGSEFISWLNAQSRAGRFGRR